MTTPTLHREVDTRTVREIALAIADEIERFGHFQATVTSPSGSRCLITATSYPIGHGGKSDEFLRALSAAAGFDISKTYEHNGEEHIDVASMVKWNDSTTTTAVINTLRSIK